MAYCFTVLYLRPWMGFYRLHPVNYSYLIANKSTIGLHVLGYGSEFRNDGDPDENLIKIMQLFMTLNSEDVFEILLIECPEDTNL